ncbi:MAG: hypothetical protein DCF19_04910 [Pseudanabaena frigida]|uniref:Lipoprotein n=1 Tax=Pseudanabaena frigida TaxID=945775 RepID=A0A2W4WFL1_9CYAN|nr:MAG: hypothetical protein DCF19_04910 [Pseudanabaena frigida]
MKNTSMLLLLSMVLGCSSFTPQVDTANTLPLTQVTPTATKNKSIPDNQPVKKQLGNSTFTDINTFTIDELFAAKGGGCGMTLQAKAAKGTKNFLFFNGISPNSMLIKINNKMTRFSLVEAVGNDFYGQKNFQIFVSEDKKIEVRIAVVQGQRGEIESLGISTGVMLVKTGDSFQELAVIGDAGC